jgi:hypothetical protein
MTELQKEFCNDVATLCEAAKAPELYKPIIKLWAIYEAELGTPTANGQNNDGKVPNMDLNNLSSTELQQNAAELQKLAEQKKAEEQAENKSTETSTILAEKMREENRQQEQENQDNAGAVNG